MCLAQAMIRTAALRLPLVSFLIAATAFTILLNEKSAASPKAPTVDFEDGDTAMPPVKLLAPAVSPYEDLKPTVRRDYLILSAKGSRIVVAIPQAEDELKIGSILVLREKNSRPVRFKVTRVLKTKVIATLQDKISNELKNSLMGRTVTLQKKKQASE